MAGFSINFYKPEKESEIVCLSRVIIILKLMSQYGRAEYWEERYSRDPGLFDWYQRYFTLRELIGANIPPEFRILNVGSGNSSKSY